MKLNTLLLFTLLAALSGCSTFYDKYVEYDYVRPDSYPVLKAVGYATISLQPGQTAEQQQLMAIKASKLEAYRELTEQVYGQKISSNTTVASSIAQNDVLQSKVTGLIRGARVMKTYAVGDTYATELELDMKLVNDLYIGEVKPRVIKRVTYY